MNNLGVVDTSIWLKDYVNEVKKIDKKRFNRDRYLTHRKYVSYPLKDYFPNMSFEELHFVLLSQGLFDPNEWPMVNHFVQGLLEGKILGVVEKEYLRLKKLWNGPHTTIFIFPITQRQVIKQRTKKNGFAFQGGLFLFLSSDSTPLDIKTLLAHEYNHSCRLALMNPEEKQLTLKESLIIEGLGEYAVKELYGEEWLAPWTRLYSSDQCLKVWRTHIVPNLNIKGIEKHQLYLFGKERSPLPKWIGYNIGFCIIESFHSGNRDLVIKDLLAKEADQLIAGSIFSYK